jgi:hypothetical protein
MWGSVTIVRAETGGRFTDSFIADDEVVADCCGCLGMIVRTDKFAVSVEVAPSWLRKEVASANIVS